MARKRRRRYTAEEKREAIALADRLGNVSQAARDLGINRSLLERWIKASEMEQAVEPVSSEAPLDEDERKRLKRLEKEVRTLRMERDFLKKAAAFFAEDTKRSS